MFNYDKYIEQIAKELILHFNGAAIATTPGLIGSLRETAIRNKLKGVLPHGVGIGTGCVVELSGKVSKQQDIVLFERDLCPVFLINEAEEPSYYPCEGVMAVGEVKSNIGKTELEDGMSKIASVKELVRETMESANVSNQIVSLYRSYLNVTKFAGTPAEAYDQENKPIDQIYGFIFCQNFSITPNTIHRHLADIAGRRIRNHLPNLIVSLSGVVYSPYDTLTESIKMSMLEGDSYIRMECNGHGFKELLKRLYTLIRGGRTVPTSCFQKYVFGDQSSEHIRMGEVILVPNE